MTATPSLSAEEWQKLSEEKQHPMTISAEGLRNLCKENARIQHQKDLDLVLPLLRDQLIPELWESVMKACAADPDITSYIKSWTGTKISQSVWKRVEKDVKEHVQRHFTDCHVQAESLGWVAISLTVSWRQAVELEAGKVHEIV